MSYESESKLTFGNILMGLLLLGVMVVIGLILFVYFTLTKSNDKHTFSPTTDTPPPQKVERLSPDGRVLPPEAPNAQAAQQPNAKDMSVPNKTFVDVQNEERAKKEAEKAANDLNNGTLAAGGTAMNGVATNGDGTQKPKPKPKPQTKPRDDSNTARNSNSGAAERELEPVNTPRRNTANASDDNELKPISSKRGNLGDRTAAAEQSLQPKRTTPRESNSGSSRSNSGGSERELQPVQKRRANTSEIENLF